MAKHIYQITGEFDYAQTAGSPGECRNFFDRILKEEGLTDKNFTIEVSRIDGKKDKEPEAESKIKSEEDTKVEETRKIEKKIRKTRKLKAKKKKKNANSSYHFD